MHRKGNDGLMATLFDLFKDDEGRWLKGNTHTHTTCSDGQLSPRQVADWYREAGYDFLFLTEHEDKLASPQALPDFVGLSADDFLVLPGIELRLQMPSGQSPHLVALGTARTGLWRPTWSLSDAAQFALDEGGVPVIGHPYWSGLTYQDIDQADNVVAVEVFNTVCQVASAKGFARGHWDYLLAEGVAIHGLAADDAHWGCQVPDYGQGWIMVKVKEFSQEGILQALHTGQFYATCGPEFRSVSRDGDEVVVETSPVQRINFITYNGHSSVEHAAGDQLLTSARRPLSSFRKFLRIECVDRQGRFAWTNALMFTQ